MSEKIYERESKVDPDLKKLKCNEHSDLFLKKKKIKKEKKRKESYI